MNEAAIPAESPVLDDASDTLALARRIAGLAQERRATDPVLLDVRALVDYTDFFLLVTGQSSRQNLAIAEHVVKTLKGEKRYALSKSGLDSGSWVCLDLGSVVVHVFDPETRARYDLELLWADAPRIDVDVVAAAPAPAAAPAAASEPAPKRRRRAVRTAAVADADAANAPDSARPPLDEPEPVAPGATPVDVDEPAPKRRKSSKPTDDKPTASAPARAPKKPRAKSAKPADTPAPARKKPSTRAPRKRGDSAK